MPRNSDIAACVWVLISPGARIASGRSSRCLAWKWRSISALRADADDALAADRHGAVLDDAPLRVLGDDVARAPDPVGGLGGERASAPRGRSYKKRSIEWPREQIFQL